MVAIVGANPEPMLPLSSFFIHANGKDGSSDVLPTFGTSNILCHSDKVRNIFPGIYAALELSELARSYLYCGRFAF